MRTGFLLMALALASILAPQVFAKSSQTNSGNTATSKKHKKKTSTKGKRHPSNEAKPYHRSPART